MVEARFFWFRVSLRFFSEDVLEGAGSDDAPEPDAERLQAGVGDAFGGPPGERPEPKFERTARRAQRAVRSLGARISRSVSQP